MSTLYNQLVPIQVEMGDNSYGACICYQVNDDDSLVLFLDHHVD